MSAPSAPPHRTARTAVTAVFLANGLGVASLLVRIPSIRDQLDLREALLGLVLSSLAIGVVSGIVLAGSLVARFGSRTLVIAGGVGMAVVLPLTGVAPNVLVLATVLIGLGVTSSLMDVGMNAQGIGVERRFGRSIMLGLHGAWSVGTLLASAAGSVAMGARVPVAWHLLGVSLGVLLLLVLALRHVRVEDRLTAAVAGPRGFSIPRGPLLPLALIVLGGALGEATAGDWSGIYLADELDASAGRVGWGLVAFTAAMTTIRVLGDRVVRRVGRQATVIAGGIAGGSGFVVVALAPSLYVAVLGFALVGLGVGVTVPLAFAAAGAVAHTPGAGVAAVASVGMLAFVVGPSAIGLAAEVVGLRTVFALVAVLIVGLIAHRQRALREAG